MVTDDDKQGFLEVRLLTGLFKELAQRPVGVAHGRQMLIQRAAIRHRLNRQGGRQRIRRVVGQGLQQCVERRLALTLFQLFKTPVEHVLIGHTPCRIREHRINEIVAPYEGSHALVAEETGLVVPGKVAVIDIHIIKIAGAQQFRQARELVAAFRGLHQVFKTRQVREARHRGKHALVGVRAVGEKALKQQPLFRQFVEVRRDIARAAQRTNRVASKAFHEDNHHVLDRQRSLRRWRGVATHGGRIRIDQLVVFG